jgi:DNA-directed RNA polymerase subunit RPC12/RpoP
MGIDAALEGSDLRRKIFFGFVAAAVLFAVYLAWTTFKTPTNSVDVPDGLNYVCKNCGNHFNVSTHELNQFQAKHYGERYPCPKCGSTNIELVKPEGGGRRERGADATTPPKR